MQKPDANLLILGGTGEAVKLADQLVKSNILNITYSVVGVTRDPVLPNVNIRTGGFGGLDGLKKYLIRNRIDIVVDITHPYATKISNSALTASKDCGISYVRYQRPEWIRQPEDQWIEVRDPRQAVSAIPKKSRVFLTIGRKDYPVFLERRDVSFIVRSIEPPEITKDGYLDRKQVQVRKDSESEQITDSVRFVVARPPFSLEEELKLLTENKIDYLVTKNSGGDVSYSKIVAARQLGLPVIVIDRPNSFENGDLRLFSDDVQIFDNLPDIISWINLHN